MEKEEEERVKEEELEEEKVEEEEKEEEVFRRPTKCLLAYTVFTAYVITLLQVWWSCALQSEGWGEEKKRNCQLSATMQSDLAVWAEPLLLQLHIATVVRVLRSQVRLLRLQG